MTGFTATAGSLAASPVRLSTDFSSIRGNSPIQSLAYVFLGGRRVWTFRVEPEHWDRASSILHIDWPAALVPHLSGVSTARLEIRTTADSPATHMAGGDLHFGDSPKELQLVDPRTGDELVLNKWGRLAKSFEAARAELQRAVLESAQGLVSLLNESFGLELFITGGTLLGLVRDGKLIANDDDADLAWPI